MLVPYPTVHAREIRCSPYLLTQQNGTGMSHLPACRSTQRAVSVMCARAGRPPRGDPRCALSDCERSAAEVAAGAAAAALKNDKKDIFNYST